MKQLSKLSIFMVAAGVAIISFVALQLSPLKVAENFYEDLLITHKSSHDTASEEIIIIEIRESTISKFPYRSPIDRKFLAKLLNKLLDAKVSAVGLDIIFDQPTEIAKDEALKAVALKGQNVIWMPQVVAAEVNKSQKNNFQDSFLSEIKTASIILAKSELDGVVRHYLADELVNGQRLQQLSAAMVGSPLNDVPGQYKRVLYQSNSSGEPHAFKTYPAEAAMLLPADWFQNKYVLIGQNIANIDQFRTSFVSKSGETVGLIPGVQIHGHILNQLLTAKEIKEFNWFDKLLGMLVASLMGAFLMTLQINVLARFILAFFACGALLLSGYLIFSASMILLPILAAIISFTASALLMSGIIWQLDRSQKLFIRQAWSHYVSEDIVDTLISNPDKLKTGGEKREASFVFTDIEGFTSLSEGLSAEELSDVINTYLDIMTEEFRTAHVTIDKIIGDAIVGFVGAPIADTDHADTAVSLALRLRDKSEELRVRLASDDIELGRTRIGINSGVAVIGNFGGSHFFDYTAFGNDVNVAARLEGANKHIRSQICVSAETARRAKRHIFRPIGKLYVEGKKKAVETWEPLTGQQQGISVLTEYQSAYDALEEDTKNAKKKFEELHQRYPSDHLVTFHLNRIQNGQTGTEIEISK